MEDKINDESKKTSTNTHTTGTWYLVLGLLIVGTSTINSNTYHRYLVPGTSTINSSTYYPYLVPGTSTIK